MCFDAMYLISIISSQPSLSILPSLTDPNQETDVTDFNVITVPLILGLGKGPEKKCVKLHSWVG